MTNNYLFTDADLIASFSQSKCGRRQYEVIFFNDFTANSMMVWADNRKEANKLSREYARRILNRKFENIFIQV